MSAFKTLDDADVKGKRCLVRVDLNVPMEDGRVTDDTRIRAVLPTITEISNKGGKVILLAHFGRPKDGPEKKYSLEQVVAPLASRLGLPVAFAADSIGPVAAAAIAEMKEGDVLLLENTRFYKGEEKNVAEHVDALAALGDLFVNDAFATAHRAHATTEGLAHRLPAYAGRCMQAELDALTKALEAPVRPVAAVVGGAKVSSKLELLGNLVKKVDYLIIGGGMANTFLAAGGVEVGKSLCEHDLAPTAREIVEKAAAAGCTVVLPIDGVAAREFKAGAANRVVQNGDIAADEMVLDAGPASIAAVVDLLSKVKTLVWNGPFGAFEIEPFDAATNAVARAAGALAEKGLLTAVAGGGDTVAALNHAGAAEQFTYISTAGGAFLEWLEGKALPGVECLRKA
ncbi:MAG: phosphoglycerate kinase [Siculibacillus sp.]